MKDLLPFELLIIRSLISIVHALNATPFHKERILTPTLKELTAFEVDWHKRQSFEESH